MDYDRLYKHFVTYCKNTSPRNRLITRDNTDVRLHTDHLYVENHHIIPTSVGGDNSADNMVLLLPEEHLIAHKIRFKAYNLRQDMLAIRFILNGLANKGHIDKCTKLRITKYIKKQYAWIRNSSAEFRLIHGWHTSSGIERISIAKKGTMPVKDAITGKMLGSVSVDHPKVVSREWVHHSYGLKLSDERKSRLLPQNGSNNNNYKTFATCDFLLRFLHDHRDIIVLDLCYFSRKKFNMVLKEHVKNKYHSKIHADTIIKNRFKSVESFINLYNLKYDDAVIYNPYYRSIEQRQFLSNINQKEIKC